MPFRTTLLAGRVDVGEVGIRVVGVLWLLIAVVMVATAIGVAVQARWAGATLLPVVVVSLVACLVELPFARIGLALNVVLVLLLLLHPTVGAGVMRWQRSTKDTRERLGASSHGPAGTFTFASIQHLPAPVGRYFRHVLTDGQPLVTSVSFIQEGQFRMSRGEDSWRPMRATQRFSVQEPGFVWDARIEAYPLLPVFVRDSYVRGEAGMVASIIGLFTVMNAPASPELDAGAIQRYLGESLWFPTALLPASGVVWEAIDDRSARATLTDRATSVSLEFQFNDADEIERVFTPSRLREVNGQYVATPWLVTCRDYANLNDMRVPTYCEVSWQLDTGLFTYWKGRLISSGL
jgi:hypothetical protein